MLFFRQNFWFLVNVEWFLSSLKTGLTSLCLFQQVFGKWFNFLGLLKTKFFAPQHTLAVSRVSQDVSVAQMIRKDVIVAVTESVYNLSHTKISQQAAHFCFGTETSLSLRSNKAGHDLEVFIPACLINQTQRASCWCWGA